MNKKRIISIFLFIVIGLSTILYYVCAIWPSIFNRHIIGMWIILFAIFWLEKKRKRTWIICASMYYLLIYLPCDLIEDYIIKHNNVVHLSYLYDKHESKGKYPDFIIRVKFDTMYENFSVSSKGLYISYKEFKKLSIGDTIVLKQSSQGGIYIKDLFPTHEKIERYKVPQHYVNGKLQKRTSYEQYSAAVRDSMLQRSHKQVGYVYEKTDDEYYRHLVKVGIDAEHTTTHEFYETDRNYTKVYKRLHVGDAVILQVADSLPEINRVLCWQPDGNDIANYATYEVIKDYSNCSKEFETEMLHQSHKRIGFVYDKYQDEHIGAYLEVGIDKKHVRTFLFKTFEKTFEKTYQTVNIGDTIILRVSDSIPQINRVLDWQPTPEQIEKYKTPVRLIEKNR